MQHDDGPTTGFENMNMRRIVVVSEDHDPVAVDVQDCWHSFITNLTAWVIQSRLITARLRRALWHLVETDRQIFIFDQGTSVPHISRTIETPLRKFGACRGIM